MQFKIEIKSNLNAERLLTKNLKPSKRNQFRNKNKKKTNKLKIIAVFRNFQIYL